MKRLSTIMMCLLAMMVASLSAKAQEVTITLMPGWTWISIPSTETMDFATALGSFTPAVGDRIKSQWGNATYRGNGEWRGQISEFYPGYGYMYYSTRQVPVTVTFNAQQPSQQVVVTTDTPQFITAISAMGGGEVTTTDGTYIIVKGLCWATHENPTTNDDFYEEAESGVGTFSISMTELNIATTYYVRAYAVTPNGTVYGDQKTFTTRDGIPEVTTDTVYNILGDGATCNGTVTDNGGLNVTARGVCWSTSSNPTLDDSHTTNGSGMGSFISTMSGMELGTTYYVRAYASTSAGTGYGDEVSFTTQSSSVGLYVDLGLPSGTLWATCNVGADYPEAYGNYFAWGETQSKTNFSWSTYQYSNGSYNTLTKYCNNPEYGYNGFTDNLTILLPEDDAASINWGAEWRMATKQEWQELIDNTTCIWTTQNGVIGRLFSASNGNSLFLPATGFCDYVNLYQAGNAGYYFSNTLSTEWPFEAWYFLFWSSYYGMSADSPDVNIRPSGCSVRAVRCKNSAINVTANPSEGGSVSGGGTYQDGTSCTITATADEGYIFMYWIENGMLVSTNASYTFTVSGNRDLVAFFYISGAYHYVDLGLPSGTLWATCNVGAEDAWEYGDYFAWAETQPKGWYNWSNYQYCNGSSNTLTKYCNKSSYGFNGFTDNLTTLLPEDDAATINWGVDWRMPTWQDWQELSQNTSSMWTTQNGINGLLFIATNGNTLFLPATFDENSYGDYWSSSLSTSYPDQASYRNFHSPGYNGWTYHYDRYIGRSVRAVYDPQN